MEKILPTNRRIGIILDEITFVLMVVLLGMILLVDHSDGFGENLKFGYLTVACFVANPILVGIAIYLLKSPKNVLIPIILNLLVVSLLIANTYYDTDSGIMPHLFFVGLFVLFVLLILPNNKFRIVADDNLYSREDQVRVKYDAYEIDKTVDFPIPDLSGLDIADDGSIISKVTEPKMFGILNIIYGIVLVACNILLNGGTGNIVGFALFAIYGAHILYSEKDCSNWGRFKYVHRFILVFGLAYVVRGILGGGDIDRVMSIVEGVILILLASYMSEKVYRMASGTRHPFVSRLLYTLVWFIVVLLLIFFVIGAPIEIVSQFNESDLATGIANVASGVVTFVIMAIVLLYFLLYCRPKQMYYEVDENEDLIRSADYFNENVEEYTVGDAVRDARYEKQKLNTEDVYSRAIIKAFNNAGYKVDYNTEQYIRRLVSGYYPNMTYSDAKKVVEKVVSNSNQGWDYSVSSKVKDNLNSVTWRK